MQAQPFILGNKICFNLAYLRDTSAYVAFLCHRLLKEATKATEQGPCQSTHLYEVTDSKMPPPILSALDLCIPGSNSKHIKDNLQLFYVKDQTIQKRRVQDDQQDQQVQFHYALFESSFSRDAKLSAETYSSSPINFNESHEIPLESAISKFYSSFIHPGGYGGYGQRSLHRVYLDYAPTRFVV